jgi:hypothetical protein
MRALRARNSFSFKDEREIFDPNFAVLPLVEGEADGE